MANINPIQLQKFLKGVDYPASKSTLLQNAKKLGADENVCASIEQLPNEDFQTPADVSQAIGKLSDTPDKSASSSGAQQFIAQALQDSLAEVELCELALQKTSNQAVKAFAQKMINDHSEMGREIEKLASKDHLTLPKDVTPEDRQVCDRMSKLSGKDFDRQFIEHNVKDHEKDIKVFSHYAGQVHERDIADFAKKGVKTLQHHLDMAREISKQLHS